MNTASDAAGNQEKWAIISKRSQLNRPALMDEAARLRDRLRALGIDSGERIGIYGENSAEFVTTFVALAMLDTSIVLIDPRQVASVAEAAAIAGLDGLLDVRRLEGSKKSEVGLRPGGSRHGTIDLEPMLELSPGPTTLQESDGGQEPPLDSWAWASREDGLVLLSSGSTGRPKPVMKKPSDMFRNCLRTHSVVGYRSQDVLLPVLPLTHQYGFSVLLLGLLLELPVVLTSAVRPSEAIRFGMRHRATVMDTTPAVYQALLRLMESGRISLDALESIRLFCVGGSPVPESLQRQSLASLGTLLLDGYGSTEMGNVAHALPGAPEKVMPLPGIELRVVDERGDDVPPGHCGRLQVRSPDLALALGPKTVDGWTATEDLATMSPSGSLTVHGRMSAINRNGLVLYPKSVQARLAAAGLSVCCLGVVDTHGAGKLVVVVEDDMRRPLSEWKRKIARAVAEQDLPDRVLVLGAFPLTANGKVDEARLARYVQAVLDPTQAASLSPAQADALGRLAAVLEYVEQNRSQVMSLLEEYCDRNAAAIELEAFKKALTGVAAELALEEPPRISSAWVYMPSNVVLYSYALYLLIPALYTDAIWFRPSSRIAETTKRLHQMLLPVHGLDIQCFTGTQREFEQLRGGKCGLVVFTGRSENAELVRERVLPGQVMAFFGQGSNPFIVGPDADLDMAVRDAVEMRMLNAGQDCFGPDLYLVHDTVALEFVRRVEKRLDYFALPAVSKDAPENYNRIRDKRVFHEIVEHLITHRSAVRWGSRLDLAAGIVEPTVLSWHVSEAPPCHEVFAPVFNIIRYDDESQVRGLLDSDEYREWAMGASVYGTSVALTRWLSERMTVSLETTLVATDEPHQPFGGSGRAAGFISAAGAITTGPVLLSRVARQYAAFMSPSKFSASSTLTSPL